MQELIKLVSEKAGISAEQATSAVQTIAEFAKSKLPPAFSSQVDKLFGGETVAGNPEPVKAGALENFGEKADDTLDILKDKADDAYDVAKEKATEVFNKLSGMFGGDKN